jgi:CheY-like chemotaxis protein
VQRILVVDDEPSIRQVVSLYLKRDGYSVREAADGDEALRAWLVIPIGT